MRRLGRSRWSMAVEARGEARCCRPADCSHRAMTASPASPPWSSSAAAAAALPCGIWPLAWRCERRWGANFQDLFARASHQTNKSSKLGPQKKKKSETKTRREKNNEAHEKNMKGGRSERRTQPLWISSNDCGSDLKPSSSKEWPQRNGFRLIMAEEREFATRRERNPLNANFGD